MLVACRLVALAWLASAAGPGIGSDGACEGAAPSAESQDPGGADTCAPGERPEEGPPDRPSGATHAAPPSPDPKPDPQDPGSDAPDDPSWPPAEDDELIALV